MPKKEAATIVRPIPGRRIPVDIKKTTENSNEYVLADGTAMRVRTVLVGVSRIKGKFNAQGDPIYEIKGGMVVDVKVPPRLKRKK